MFRDGFVKFVERCWYSQVGWLIVLLPLEWLFRLAVFFRRNNQLKKKQKIPVPTVVVGNITVGGTGKTPVIIALATYLKAQGFHPGVISRGYLNPQKFNSQAAQQTNEVGLSVVVTLDSDPKIVGDEPLLIIEKAACPVVVNPDRVRAGKDLIRLFPECNVVLCDDGLQHYKMHRDIEICVFDGERLLGNGHQLPVGPLRENIARLRDVDWVLVNGLPDATGFSQYIDKPVFNIEIEPVTLVNLESGETKPLQYLAEIEKFIAVAGIGNPKRFFTTLGQYTDNFDRVAFADHHAFKLEDFVWFGQSTVIMTEKDAVKCREFAKNNWWYLDVEANIQSPFLPAFHRQLNAIAEKLSHP